MEGPYDPRRWTYEAAPSPRESRRRPNSANSKVPKPVQGQKSHHSHERPGVRDHPSRPSQAARPPWIPTSLRPQNGPRATTSAEQVSGARHSAEPPFTLRGSVVMVGIFLALFLAGTFSWLSWSSRLAVDDIPPAVEAHIARVVDRTVNRALRDPVGRRDFALLADGGILLPELTEVTSNRNFLRPRQRGLRPEAALDDDLRIGNCWSIPGAAGQLGFRLSAMIHPTHVSIDHIPLEIAADISRAPREIAMWGGVDGPYKAMVRNLTQSHNITLPALRGRSGPPNTRGYDFALLAHFEYDIHAAAHVQTFPLQQLIVDSEIAFGVIVVEVLSNWGGESTCLYRVRVHGDVADVLV